MKERFIMALLVLASAIAIYIIDWLEVEKHADKMINTSGPRHYKDKISTIILTAFMSLIGFCIFFPFIKNLDNTLYIILAESSVLSLFFGIKNSTKNETLDDLSMNFLGIFITIPITSVLINFVLRLLGYLSIDTPPDYEWTIIGTSMFIASLLSIIMTTISFFIKGNEYTPKIIDQKNKVFWLAMIITAIALATTI